MASSLPTADTPLLAASRWLDAPAVVASGRTWTWREVHAASLVFAARLDGASAIFNLCNSRLAFLVALLAALRRGLVVVLPPSGGSADLSAVVNAGAAPLVVGDVAAWPEPWCADRYLRCVPSPGGTADDAALAWRPDADATALVLYTSGSTGRPEPQRKTLGQLVEGARLLGRRLDAQVEGGLETVARIVCSVPPQHMFGLECSVMLPLVRGLPVDDGRPLLPADVQQAFAGGSPGLWVATPLHLRGFAEAAETLPACRAVVASTMPLAPGLAERCEALLRSPVLEIYGSTETGALALRRSAREARWRPLDGVSLQADAASAVASGRHFASPARLLDAIDLDADGHFELLGRHADLVKIGGRRASLAGLDLLLQELPGLDDGAFYLPSGGRAHERLCVVYSGAPIDRDAARRWLRERLDPVFLPRTFIRVERLPRGDGGKLRRPALDRLYAEWQSGLQPALPGETGVAVDRTLRS